MKKYLISLLFVVFAQASLANDPNEMAQQCEQYGSYQDDSGEWITCEFEEEPLDGDVDTEEDSTEYEEESTF